MAWYIGTASRVEVTMICDSIINTVKRCQEVSGIQQHVIEL